jgi:hypothetical protein
MFTLDGMRLFHLIRRVPRGPCPRHLNPLAVDQPIVLRVCAKREWPQLDPILNSILTVHNNPRIPNDGVRDIPLGVPHDEPHHILSGRYNGLHLVRKSL